MKDLKKMDYEEFADSIFQYVDQIKDFLSPSIWQNVLLDCSKNEILILWLLFRRKEVNMTAIAEYIGVPLNTATGIVSRMEKKKLIVRERSTEDKRIVTIRMGEDGDTQIQTLLKEFMYYGQKILTEFSTEEIELIFQLMERFANILKEKKTETKKTKIRKITIE